MKALSEKPTIVQVESFCNPNLSSGTALQQDFVIRRVGSNHLMMNILAAVHFALYISFAVITSEINPTDHKSVISRHFPDEDFREADSDSLAVESERDNKLLEAEF